MSQLPGDRLIIGRVACGLVATVVVLVTSPAPWVLVAVGLCVWPVGVLEWLGARRRLRADAWAEAAALH